MRRYRDGRTDGDGGHHAVDGGEREMSLPTSVTLLTTHSRRITGGSVKGNQLFSLGVAAYGGDFRSMATLTMDVASLRYIK